MKNMECRKDLCNLSTACNGQACEEAESMYKRMEQKDDNIELEPDCSKCDCKDEKGFCDGRGCESHS